MITHLIVIPGEGHFGSGHYSRGPTAGLYSALDLIDYYGRYFLDDLSHYGIRHQVIGTRKAPGLTKEQREDLVETNSLVVNLSLGWHTRPRKRNSSTVQFAGKDGERLAEDLLDSLYEWGTCSVFGHVRNCPQKVEKVLPEGATWINIEPFVLNGTGLDDYVKRLRHLGFDLARFFADWVKRVNPAMGYKPQTLPSRGLKTSL